MQDVFLKIVSMGINASWMILAVLLLRLLFWRSSKGIMCFFWIFVGIRLLCPWNIESAISLVPIQIENPSEYTETNIRKTDEEKTYLHINQNPILNRNTNEIKTSDTADHDNVLVNIDVLNKQIVFDNTMIRGLMMVWLCGMFVMLVYLFASSISIYKKTETATRFMENIWESEFVDSPFVFGIVRPKIYIPYGIDSENLVYILAHERTHIKRNDHILKLAAFLILSVYWFHPLVWISYIFLSRDIEFACDEKATAAMDDQERKNYMLTLLNCSTAKRTAGIHPVAFGEIGMKERVIHIKKWKKPSILFMLITLLIGISISFCFLTNPTEQKKDTETLEAKQASVDLSATTGADGTMLYYVDENKIVFGGYFGLFVYDKTSAKITQSLDLEYIGCQQTQGDEYCAIAADKQGQRIYLNPLGQKKLYLWDLKSGKLEATDYQNSDIWTDRSLDLFPVENTKQVSYYNDKEEEILCTLNEKDFTIGNCCYAEYKRSDPGNEKDRTYYPFFSHKE